MRKKTISFLAAIAVFLLFILPSAWESEANSDPGQRILAKSPDNRETPRPANVAFVADTSAPTPITQVKTAVPEVTGPAKGEEPELAGAESTNEILTTRTPAPTATPGVIQDAVDDFTTAIGLDQETFLGLTADDWINLVISGLWVLVGYLLATWLVGSVLRGAAQRTPSELDETILEAAGPQIKWLIVVISARFATVRLTFLSPAVKATLQDVYFVLLLALGTWLVWKFSNLSFAGYREILASKGDAERLDPLLTLAHRAVLVAVLTVGLIILLGHFGVNVTGLVAALGIAGLALSLAAQDTLSDALTGVMILLDQPFRVGDQIQIPELGTWGDVVQIGTRTTRVRTRDNRMVIVPNSTIGKSQVINYTYPDPHYRVQMDIGIAYGTAIERTQQIIVDTVSEVDGVLPDKPVDALYSEMGDSTMVFRVRWWIESVKGTRPIFNRVNTALQHALDDAGIEMPFTTYDVNLKMGVNDPGEIL
jgi:MscS family membrane protein